MSTAANSNFDFYRYVCINECGVRAGEARQLKRMQDAMWERVEKKIGTCPDDWSMELGVLGSADHITLHALPEPRYLAVPTAMGPAQHMRTIGAALPLGEAYSDLDGSDFITRSWPEINNLGLDPSLPFVSLVHIKLDPFSNLVTVENSAQKLILSLDSIIRRGLERFNSDNKDKAPNWPTVLPESLSELSQHLRILPLIGLDTAEVVLVIRVQRLDLLMRVAWVLRYTRLKSTIERHDQPDTWRPLAQALTPMWKTLHPAATRTTDDTARWLAEKLGKVPLLARASVTIGMRYRYLAGANAAAQRRAVFPEGDKTVAFQTGTLLTQLQVLPGGHDSARAALLRLEQAHRLAPTAATGSTMSQDTASMTGRYDLRYNGQQLTRYTVEHLARIMAVSLDDHTDQQADFALDTLVIIKAFPPDEIHRAGTYDSDCPAQLFYQRLRDQQARWLEPGSPRLSLHRPVQLTLTRHESESHWTPPFEIIDTGSLTPYRLLLDAAERGQWPYSRTNAAANMLISLVLLLTNRGETEAFLDLAEPLIGWLLQANRDPHNPEQSGISRIYKGIDRLIRARGSRDGAHRQPDIVRSFEARAGQILPRNALLSLIVELLRQRGHRGAPPLLVDGSESALSVKLAVNTGLFIVSSLHLQQPFIWAAVAHECEHIRLNSTPFSVKWHRHYLNWHATIQRHTGTPCLPPETRTFSGALEHLVDHTRSLSGRDSAWKNWVSVVNSVAEAAYDIAILDGPLLPGDPSEYPASFIRVLMPSLLMELSIGVVSRREKYRALKLIAVRFIARLATSLGLYTGAPPGSASDTARMGEAILEQLQPDALPIQTARLALQDMATRLDANHIPLEPILQTSIEDLMSLIKIKIGWSEMAVFIHQARSHTPNPIPGGAAEALRQFIADMEDLPSERIFYQTHPRGGLLNDSAHAARQRKLHLGLLEAMRGPIQRWRSLSMQAFLVNGRYCATGSQTPEHEDAFNQSFQRRRWCSLLARSRFQEIWLPLLVTLPWGGPGVEGLPFWRDNPGGPWKTGVQDFNTRLATILGCSLLEGGLLPGPRLVAADETTNCVAVISMNPSTMAPALHTTVNYPSIIHYCHTLLNVAARPPSTDGILLSAHEHHHPPPATWLSGAVLLWGKEATALLWGSEHQDTSA